MDVEVSPTSPDALAELLATDLLDLVEHSASVPADLPVGAFVDRFRSADASYVAVLREEEVVGVISTESIGRFMGARYGFALHARESVMSKIEPAFLKFRRSAGILEVLNAALNRAGHAFLSDVVLLDDSDRYVGMIPVYRLAQLQSRLLEAQRAREVAISAKALWEEKTLLQSVLNSMADGVVVSDGFGTIHMFNPAAEDILKIRLDRSAPRRWHKEYRFFDPFTKRRYHLKDTPFLRAARGETVHAKEVLARHCATKEELWLSVNAMPLRLDATDERCVLVFRDITEQKRTEERLRHAKELAEQADRAKSAFLANMSHELRTPLNAILGYSEMLVEELEQRNTPEYLGDLSKIHTAGKHLLSVINNILDLSKIEAGRTEVLIDHLDFRKVIEEVLGTIEPLARNNSNVLSVTVPDTLVVESDQAKLRQVLLNLLGNACKFTENGSISVHAELKCADGQKQLEVRIQDTGIGMQPDQLESLFEPFVQADSSTARKYGGTGLGLAISRKLCRILGGDLTADSVLRKGSTFVMRVPVNASETVGHETPSERGTLEGSFCVSGNNDCVVVIDNDPDACQLLARLLMKQKLHPIVCKSAMEGIEAARNCRPRVITLDVLMDGMNGWVALQKLKTDPDLKDIPVIMITVVDDRKRALALGAAAYLPKPLDTEAFHDAIESCLANEIAAIPVS